MRTEELLQDIGAFIPLWRGEWEPDPRMLDFEEKWESFHAPGGRLMVCAHRGDRNELYPENSLEGFLSAILAGADILEADVHTARDGELIVMHDDTLTRTTDLSLRRTRGETGFPESDAIADWTLPELRRLRLMTVKGEPTPYAIPTLRELIGIAKDRCFITLDKSYAFSFEEGVMPLLRESGAWRTVLIPYEYPFSRVIEIQREIGALAALHLAG